MRGAFLEALTDLAAHDPRIVLLTADLGYLAVECFAQRFPGRFFNVGVAEQNMIGLATGLAEAGFLPFVYSIGTFALLRPYEFIRNGPVAQKLPARIVGIGGGMEYGHDGLSHYTVDDLGIARVQPGLTLIVPADAAQAAAALRETVHLPRPIYYRLGKNDRLTVPGLNGSFELARLQWIAAGDDILFLATGSVAYEAAEAVRLLRDEGIRCAAAVVSSFNPDPVEDLIQAFARFRVVITVECHYVTGGLGSLAAEVMAEHGLGAHLIRCGLRETPDGITGSLEYLYSRYGLSAASLAETARRAIQRPAGGSATLSAGQ